MRARQWKTALRTSPSPPFPTLIEFAQREDIQFTVVGPEVPLAAGIVDAFRAAGLKIFGPTKAAAQLESSKDFAKRFMQRHNIPTGFFETFSDIGAARAYRRQTWRADRDQGRRPGGGQGCSGGDGQG